MPKIQSQVTLILASVKRVLMAKDEKRKSKRYLQRSPEMRNLAGHSDE
jgi:hypothetical protein